MTPEEIAREVENEIDYDVSGKQKAIEWNRAIIAKAIAAEREQQAKIAAAPAHQEADLLLVVHAENGAEVPCSWVGEAGYSDLFLTEEIAELAVKRADCSCQESSQHRVARYREV